MLWTNTLILKKFIFLVSLERIIYMNEEIIEGQISIFELPIVDSIIDSKEKKNKNISKPINNKLNEIINLYSENCSRIKNMLDKRNI